MKKYLFIISVFILFVISVQNTHAACYYSGDPNFNSCLAGPTSNVCWNSSATIIYACCDSLLETCPPEIITTPTIPPTPPPGLSPTPIPPGACPDLVHGCYFCDWATTSCYWNPGSSTTCAFGYYPDKNLCTSLSDDENTCSPSTARVCITDTNPYCCSVTLGCYTRPTAGCNTSAGEVEFPDRAACVSNCNNMASCFSQKGVCQSNCLPGQSAIAAQGCLSNRLCCTGISAFCLSPNDTVYTAFGCIPYQPAGFASKTLTWGTLLGAGVSFLVILFAAFQLATSGGDKTKIQAARELVIAALTALILFVIALTLLNFLGIKVLNLVGLGFNV